MQLWYQLRSSGKEGSKATPAVLPSSGRYFRLANHTAVIMGGVKLPLLSTIAKLYPTLFPHVLSYLGDPIALAEKRSSVIAIVSLRPEDHFNWIYFSILKKRVGGILTEDKTKKSTFLLSS